jgi:hypothetical protein
VYDLRLLSRCLFPDEDSLPGKLKCHGNKSEGVAAVTIYQLSQDRLKVQNQESDCPNWRKDVSRKDSVCLCQIQLIRNRTEVERKCLNVWLKIDLDHIPESQGLETGRILQTVCSLSHALVALFAHWGKRAWQQRDS